MTDTDRLADRGNQSNSDTVRMFVERYVTEGDQKYTLEELWEAYSELVISDGVPREKFKWHLVNSLPNYTVRKGLNEYGNIELSEVAT